MKTLTLMSIALLGVLAVGNGCDGGREGERCNPNVSHNECDDGLTCVQPATCVENYCCPAGPSANPYCNGAACPTPDASAQDAAPDTGTIDGGAD
jgi:hypothetical protein